MAEWDVSKIPKALNDYNSKTVGNGEQKEIKVTTEDIRKALKELGKKEENPNEKTFVDFDDGAVTMPSDADLQKILEKLEKKGNKPDISISIQNQENGDKMTTMATNEEGGDNISPNPEKPINKLPNPITLAMGENGDAINLTPEQKEKINKIFEDIQNGKIQQFPSLETTKAMGEEGGSSSLDGTISNEELAKLLKKYL